MDASVSVLLAVHHFFIRIVISVCLDLTIRSIFQCSGSRIIPALPHDVRKVDTSPKPGCTCF